VPSKLNKLFSLSGGQHFRLSACRRSSVMVKIGVGVAIWSAFYSIPIPSPITDKLTIGDAEMLTS